MGPGEHPTNVLIEGQAPIDEGPSEPARPAVSTWVSAGIYATVFGLLGLLGWSLVRAQAGPRSAGRAPEFSLTTFDGETIALADLHG